MATLLLLVDVARRDPLVGLFTAAGHPVKLRSLPRHPEDRRGFLLLHTLEALLDAHGGWPGIVAVGVGIGPGPMSGTRVGIAFAKALARARPIELRALPAWVGYLPAGATGPTSVRLPLDARWTAVATVDPSQEPWAVTEIALEPRRPDEALPRWDPERAGAALAVAAPVAPDALEPIYLRRPDVAEQVDAFGRPLRKEVTP